MPDKPLNPRNSWADRLTRQTEPYHYERQRSSIHSNYPRPAQPAFQPNQKFLQGLGMTTFDYWQRVFLDYLKRR